MRNLRVPQNRSSGATSQPRSSPLPYTSEQQPLFPSLLASRRLPLPPGKDICPSASDEEEHFHRRPSCVADLFVPARSKPNPTHRFPVHYHAIGHCLAHPDRACRCIKTREMAQSQGFAWRELGSRFKHVARTVSAPQLRSVIHYAGRTYSTPDPAGSAPPTHRRVPSMSTPTACGVSTPKTLASPGTALSRSSTPKPERPELQPRWSLPKETPGLLRSVRRRAQAFARNEGMRLQAFLPAEIFQRGRALEPGRRSPVQNGASPRSPGFRRRECW